MNKKPWWMCPLEWETYQSPNWELVHNGQQNPIQFEFPADQVRYFTRKYRCCGGEWAGLIESLTFKYDLRKRRGDVCGVEWREPRKQKEFA